MDPLSDAEIKVNSAQTGAPPSAGGPRAAVGRAFRGLRLALARRRRAARRRRRLAAATEEALEAIAVASAPLACSPQDCRRGLGAVLERAAAHLRGALARIPGPVELAAGRWGEDPLLRAFFVAPEAIRRFLAADPALRAFFARSGAETAFALLTARRSERTVFVPALEGDVLCRDSAQRLVEFEDVRLLEPSPDEESLRRAIARRLIVEIVGRLVEETLTRRRRREALREHRKTLAVQWKIACTACGAAADERPPEALSAIDHEIEELSAAAAGGEAFLERLARLLAAPEKAFSVRPLRLRLNWLGVRLPAPPAGGEAGEIALAEWAAAEGESRAVVFVAVRRSDAGGPSPPCGPGAEPL
ncbi:MAG: hypothetical protein WHT06_11400 [Desulfobacterales bacterium]